jgi:hypothetical protein
MIKKGASSVGCGDIAPLGRRGEWGWPGLDLNHEAGYLRNNAPVPAARGPERRTAKLPHLTVLPRYSTPRKQVMDLQGAARD